MSLATGMTKLSKTPTSSLLTAIRRDITFHSGLVSHRCMGNRLAEMQLRIVWEEILKRFKRIEVVREPGRTQSSFVKGYTDLQVVVTAK